MPKPKFFRYFPTTTVNINGTKRLITDITRAVIPNMEVVERIALFYNYTIIDGQRPDHVAFQEYGDSAYYWVILVINQIFDVYKDWPMSNRELETYIIDTYGSVASAQATISKYRHDVDGIYVSRDVYLEDTTDISTLSQYDVEVEKNEAKREIRLVKREYLTRVINEVNRLFEG